MKIALISPYEGMQAIGVRIVSSYLKREGHDVKVLFMPQLFTEPYDAKTLAAATDFLKESDLVGISLMTNYFDNAVQITRALKEKCGMPVIWGGVHPTIRPEESLEHADMVCIGEGEMAFVELVRRMEAGDDYRNVRSIWLNHDGAIVRNDVWPLVQDLDSVPFQDYDYARHHISDRGRIVELTPELLKSNLNREYMTMATRGCPFGCTYCFNNTYNAMYRGQKPLRRRSIGGVLDELRVVKRNLPFLELIKFDDDNFFSYSRDEIRQFSEGYRKDIGIPLIITGVAPSTLTSEQLGMLIDAGLVGLRMGIQTACETTKRMYKRRHSNDQVLNAARIINEYKHIIRPQYDIIIDNPYETDDDLAETLRFLSHLPVPYLLSIYSLNLYPGTELYNKAKADGSIVDDHEDIYRKYYHSCRKTYINRLFFLLDTYARSGSRIHSPIMACMTSSRMRRIGAGHVVYGLMKLWSLTFSFKRIAFLMKESVKDVRRGDWFRIKMKMRKYASKVRRTFCRA